MWESFQGSRRGRIACKKRSSGFGGKNPIVSRATTDNLCELSTVERDEPLRIEAGSRGSSGAVKFSRGPTESLSRPKRSEHVELKEERKQEEERRAKCTRSESHDGSARRKGKQAVYREANCVRACNLGTINERIACANVGRAQLECTTSVEARVVVYLRSRLRASTA